MVLGAGALAALVGCGNSGGSGSDPAEAACDAWARATCDNLARCTPHVLRTSVGSVERCVERQRPACVARLHAPETAETAQLVAACAAALPDVACTAFGANGLPEACRPRPGKRPNGEACAVSSQCESTYCKKGKWAQCGVCMERGGPTWPCESTADCAFGLQCSATSTTKQCLAEVYELDKCDASHICVFPLFCKLGKCAQGSGEGAACDPLLKDCVPGTSLFCHVATKQCEPRPYVGLGEPCGYIEGGFVACDWGGTCKLEGGGKGHCAAVPDEGASCDENADPACTGGLVCHEGTCRPDDPQRCG